MRPTRFLVLLLTLPLLASVAVAFSPALIWILAIIDAVVVFVVTLDAVGAWWSARGCSAQLSAPTIWSLGRPGTVTMAVSNPGALTVNLRACPDFPVELGPPEEPRDYRIPGRQLVTDTWICRPLSRGAFALAGVHIALRSPLGLWQRLRLLPIQLRVHVYPDLQQIGDYALLARTGRLNLIGVRTARRGGGDSEFDRLRDWRHGDALARVDWKATARRDQLTVRDYRTSQNQNVILMVDAGRMMVGESGERGRSLLDVAIDAALMLAWVAAHQGDRVGLIAYADGVSRWIPAEAGPRQVTRIVHALHDLRAQRVESRHEEAFLHLDRHERKRSLVVMLTSILDDADADLVERHCQRLAGRHLPLCVLLHDHDLHDRLPTRETIAAQIDADPAVFWRAGAAAALLNWRQGLIDRLRGQGCLTIDSPPERLTADVISRYLSVKARHLL